MTFNVTFTETMSAAAAASATSTSSYDCPLCNFSCPTKNLWLSHLRRVHSNDDNFYVTCDINNCGTSYTKCSSFVSHVYRQHRDNMVITTRQHSSLTPENDSGCRMELVDDVSFDGDIDHEQERNDLQHIINGLLEIDEEEQTKKAALFILHLKERRNLSQVAVDDVLKEVNGLFSHVIGRIKAGVHECMTKSNPVESINELFASATNPFQPLHSTYLQETYYQSHLGCMVSSCLLLAINYT